MFSSMLLLPQSAELEPEVVNQKGFEVERSHPEKSTRADRMKQRRDKSIQKEFENRRAGGDRWFSDRSIFLTSAAAAAEAHQVEEPEDTCFHERLSTKLHHQQQQQQIISIACDRKLRAPMSKLKIKKSTSVCLTTSTRSRNLLLQLMLIALLIIMVPLMMNVKCSIAVASAHQHHHNNNNHLSPKSSSSVDSTAEDLNQALSSSIGSYPDHHKRQQPNKSYSQKPFIRIVDVSNVEYTSEKSTSEQPNNSLLRRTTTNQLTQATSGGLRRLKRAANEQHLGCNQLTMFWNFLKGAYPSLTSHLFSLASSTPKGEDRYMVHSTVKAIGRLLEDAERLAREQLARSGGLRQSTSGGGWLARVSANPLYSRIVQHFQNQQRIQQQQQQQLANKAELTEGSNPIADSSTSHVYGRIIHYPHEASSEASSKTLNKLKLLSQRVQPHHHHNQQQQQQQQSNEIDRPSIGSSSDETESNRIPLVMTGDGEPWPTGSHNRKGGSRIEPDNVESARNKYVYGDVLLRPSQKGDQQQQQQQSNHHHRHSSLGVLRQLSDDLERSDELKLASQKQQQQHMNEPTSESYGRVLVSPPNLSQTSDRSQTVGEVKEATGSGQQTATTLLSQNVDKSTAQVAAAAAADRSQQQQQPLEFNVGGDSGGLVDELANQQHGASVSVDAPPSPSEESSDEFAEGVWYSGPLQQIGVRQLRSDRTKEDESITRTTSNPKEATLVD